MQSANLIESIEQVVIKYFGIDEKTLKGSRGKESVAWARFVYCYLCRKHARVNYSELGRTLSRDHTTIMHAVGQVEGRIKIYPEYADEVKAVERMLCDEVYEKAFPQLTINDIPK